MNLRYPDHAVTMTTEALAALDAEGVYTAELKLDGWRTFIARDQSQNIIGKWGQRSWGRGKDSSLFFLSKRPLTKGGPTAIPVCDDILKAVENLDLPDQSMLDCEWMARRTIDECPEKLFVFDTLWLADKWCGDEQYAVRRKNLEDLVLLKECAHLGMPPFVNTGFVNYFNESKRLIPWAEGLFLKHARSRIKGGVSETKENALWVRIKWRAGASGRDVVA
jgi:hypothetical protein